DAAAMRVVEGVSDFNRAAEHLVERQRALGEPRRQRLTFQILHDEKMQPVVLPNVVERPDMRVVEARDRVGLAFEPLVPIAVLSKMERKDLDRYGTTEP